MKMSVGPVMCFLLASDFMLSLTRKNSNINLLMH